MSLEATALLLNCDALCLEGFLDELRIPYQAMHYYLSPKNAAPTKSKVAYMDELRVQMDQSFSLSVIITF